MLPTHRRPLTPGEMLKEGFLDEMGMTQGELAEKMGVPIQRVNLLINGKRAVTADTAIRLGEVLGTGPEFWMNSQNQVDLWDAQQALKAERAGPKRAPAARRPAIKKSVSR